MDSSHVKVVSHALMGHSLTLLRDKTTGDSDFRRHANIVAKILVAEATRELSIQSRVIETPLAEFEGTELAGRIVLVPVLRAGLAMLPAAQEIIPDCPTGFMGLQRDEQTAEAHRYYESIPNISESHHVLVLDPMLATGGSLVATLDAIKQHGGTRVTVVCVVAAPEGIERVQQQHPDTRIIIAAVDDSLNNDKFIVPGLGDFGDRYFGT